MQDRRLPGRVGPQGLVRRIAWRRRRPPLRQRANGERLLRRLLAALNGLPARIVGAGATPGRRGRGCENTLAAMPHQALGAGGRSRHGRSGPFGTGRQGRLAARRCNRAGCAFAAP